MLGHRHWHLNNSLHWRGNKHLNWHTARHRDRVRTRHVVWAVDGADHAVRLGHVHIPGHNLRNRHRLIDFDRSWDGTVHHTLHHNLVWHSLNDWVRLRNINRHRHLHRHGLLDRDRARTGNIHGNRARNHTLNGDRIGNLHRLWHWLWHCHGPRHRIRTWSRHRNRVLAGNLDNLLHNGNLNSSTNFLDSLPSTLLPIARAGIAIRWRSSSRSKGRSGSGASIPVRAEGLSTSIPEGR